MFAHLLSRAFFLSEIVASTRRSFVDSNFVCILAADGMHQERERRAHKIRYIVLQMKWFALCFLKGVRELPAPLCALSSFSGVIVDWFFWFPIVWPMAAFRINSEWIWLWVRTRILHSLQDIICIILDAFKLFGKFSIIPHRLRWSRSP